MFGVIWKLIKFVFSDSNNSLLGSLLLSGKVGCSTRGHGAYRLNAPWTTAFNSTAAARSKFQASACHRFPSSKSNLIQLSTPLLGFL